jgi:transcriptional regulator with XRE-family HTH domain
MDIEKRSISKSNIGKKIRFFREMHGLSREKLAEKIGLSDKSIAQIERGESGTSLDNLFAIARLFDISIDYLIDPDIDIKGEAPFFKKNSSAVDTGYIPKIRNIQASEIVEEAKDAVSPYESVNLAEMLQRNAEKEKKQKERSEAVKKHMEELAKIKKGGIYGYGGEMEREKLMMGIKADLGLLSMEQLRVYAYMTTNIAALLADL